MSSRQIKADFDEVLNVNTIIRAYGKSNGGRGQDKTPEVSQASDIQLDPATLARRQANRLRQAKWRQRHPDKAREAGKNNYAKHREQRIEKERERRKCKKEAKS